MKNCESKINKIVFGGLGFFSTASCLAIILPFGIVSFYTICQGLSMFILIRSKKRSNYVKGVADDYFILWIGLSLLSCLFGYLYFIGEPLWQKQAVGCIPKILIYLFFYLLLRKDSNRFIYVKYILVGVIIGAAINCCWAMIDAIIYYLQGISITNELFRSYILAADMKYEELSLIREPFIRSSGLNGDPANIGMLAPILAAYALYSKKSLLYVLSIGAVFASVSIVALASIFIITVIYLVSNLKNLKRGIIVLLVAPIFIIPIMSLNDDLSKLMFEAVRMRLESKQDAVEGNDKDNARLVYWVDFLPAAASHPTFLLIGTGYGTASRAYNDLGFVTEGGKFPYDPEQTYCSTYFNCGLIGFMAFILLYIMLIKRSNKMITYCQDKDMWLLLFSGLLGSTMAYMGYHYTLYSVSMLILISGVLLNPSVKQINNEKIIYSNRNLQFNEIN